MNTPSPLVPQGSLPSSGKSKVRIAFFSIVLIHVVLIGGLLIQGCSQDTPAPVANEQDQQQQQEPPPADPALVETSNAVPPVDPALNAGTSATPATPATQVPTPAPAVPQFTPPPPPPIPPAPSGAEYTIVKGDTLGGIAAKSRVTLKALLEANPNVNPTKLQIGQKLQIPAATLPTSGIASGVETAVSEANFYVVKSGDMLERIARKHGTTVKAIVALNGLKSANSLKVGQKLKIPAAKEAAAPAAFAPAAVPTPVPAAPISTVPVSEAAAAPAAPAPAQ